VKHLNTENLSCRSTWSASGGKPVPPTPVTPYYQPDIGPATRPATIDVEVVDWCGGMLIRSTNWLGDAVMTLPAVYKLRQLMPADLPLIIACPKKLAGLWEAVPWVDRIISFTGKRMPPECRRELRALRPGLTIVLPNSFGAVWDLWRAGIPNLLGRDGRGRGAFLKHRLPAWQRVAGHDLHHQAREYLAMAAACGAHAWDYECPPLKPQPQTSEQAEVDRMLAIGTRMLAIAPGAAYGLAKQWPAAHFNTVARWWSNTVGIVAACGAPGEESVAESAIDGCKQAQNLAGKTTLTQLMYLLSRADFVVTNDSGAMHLAAALKKPGIAVFGSTDPVATGPIGGHWIVFRKPLPCSPCLARTCHRSDFPYQCLHAISSQTVIDTLTEMIAD